MPTIGDNPSTRRPGNDNFSAYLISFEDKSFLTAPSVSKINERSLVMRSRHVPTGSRSPLDIACMLRTGSVRKMSHKDGRGGVYVPSRCIEDSQRKFAAEILDPSGWASVANENTI
jgi:hypothetical protein